MTLRRLAAASLLVLVLPLSVLAPSARAQGYGDDGGGRHHRHAGASPADTSSFLPRWIHPWIELGGDWLDGPKYMKGLYTSGEAFAAGLTARPNRRIEYRLALDFQTLQVQRSAPVLALVDSAGYTVLDTLSYQFNASSWSGVLRPEVGVMLGGDVWLDGGLGFGYMDAGYSDPSGYTYIAPAANAPDSERNGWGWLWSAGLRWEVEPDPMFPLGLEFRGTGLKRGPDTVRTLSVRISYRIPTSRGHSGEGR